MVAALCSAIIFFSGRRKGSAQSQQIVDGHVITRLIEATNKNSGDFKQRPELTRCIGFPEAVAFQLDMGERELQGFWRPIHATKEQSCESR